MTASTRNSLILVLSLVAVAGGIVAWRQYQELLTLRPGAAAGDYSDLRRQLAAAEQRVRELEDQLAARRSAELTAPADDSATPTGGRGRGNAGRAFGGPGGRGGRGAEFRAALDNPQGQRLVQQQQKLALDSRFAPLFKNLNLPPEKLEQFKSLLLEKQTAAQDVMLAAQQEGLDPRENRDEMRKLMAATQTEIDGSLKALLGDAGFAQYEQYQQTQPQRTLVNQLQQSLSYTAAPLTTAQADQLVQILASTAPTPANDIPMPGRGGFGGGPGAVFGGAVGGGGPMGGGTSTATITPEAVSLAQQVLSAPQVEALQQLQQTQQAQQQLNEMMRPSRGDAPPRGGG